MVKIETIPVYIPLQQAFITGVGSAPYIDNVLVKLYTDNDIIGFGEASPFPPFSGETPETILNVIHKYLGSVVVGEDPFNLEKILYKMDKVLPGNMTAKAGIDIALHDIIGKILKIPVYRLLGGLFQEKVPLSFSIATQDTKKDVEKTLELVEKGLKIFKIKTAVLSPTQDIERVGAIRNAVGYDIDLRVDANQGWTPDVAISTIKKLEKFELTYIEQPVPYWDIRGMVRVKEAVSTPILADESAYTVQDAIRIITEKAADIISIKIAKPGGLYNSKKLASIAEAANIPCYAGAMLESGVGIAASLHFAASTRIIKYGSDFYIPKFLMKEDIIVNSLQIKNGDIYVPKGIGLGVDIDEEKVNKYSSEPKQI